MSLLLLFGGGAPAVPASHRHDLTLISTTRGAVSLAVPTRHLLSSAPSARAALGTFTPSRGSLGGELGYGSAIPGNSPWAAPGSMIPGDADTEDWMRDEADLTPAASTRATLTPA